MTPFTPDVVAAIMRHMNGDHADDCRVICQGLGGRPDATAATMSGMDAAGMDFVATVDGAPVPVRIPFRAPLTERRQVRAEAARMYRESCAVLGLTPRPDAT
ncbi:DUF2470 domain-containing protein [Micromonospora sp. WMMD812]|uniref:DUF2470 domain-containing protein n=1 Tax=Micromonospora sp. WMMD812 TaxID=3015152 RepID=UPI00248C4EB8|nr:DUF2470 domain-containing protein [Micromonospora sp. WMMD812]WBB67853.1 DUF2470 domain-containing protein [Micromonospora sp. WMMD812]